MKAGSRILLALSLLAIIGIVWYRYDQYVTQRNFTIYAVVACDPAEGTCFVADCSSVEGEDCDATPYKKVEILANSAPKCIEEHSCETFACAPGTACSETFCTEDSLEEGEMCHESMVTEEPAAEIIDLVEDEQLEVQAVTQ